MDQRVVECVPNFSEGRDRAKIKQITDAIEAVPGVRLLDVDPGADTNRTVVTFVGDPDAVAEGAFQAIAKAAQVLDMGQHHGAHPRMGATDVCPFIPIAGVTMDDCAALARTVGERVGRELEIPVYLYEAAATRPERKNLAAIRRGEYEGLAEKLRDPDWAPDFGPARFNPKAGATVIGAREFLIAYNVTLNTRDKALATDIAFELREKGRVARARDAIVQLFPGKDPHLPRERLPVRELRIRRRDIRRDGRPLPRGARLRPGEPPAPERHRSVASAGGAQGLPGGEVHPLQGDRLVRGRVQAGADLHQPHQLQDHAAAPGPGRGSTARRPARARRDGERGRGSDPLPCPPGGRPVLPQGPGQVPLRSDTRHPAGRGRSPWACRTSRPSTSRRR